MRLIEDIIRDEQKCNKERVNQGSELSEIKKEVKKDIKDFSAYN